MLEKLKDWRVIVGIIIGAVLFISVGMEIANRNGGTKNLLGSVGNSTSTLDSALIAAIKDAKIIEVGQNQVTLSQAFIGLSQQMVFSANALAQVCSSTVK